MRVKTVLGSLLLSVALCSSGFSFELLDRLLGLENCSAGNCGACSACQPACDPCAQTKCGSDVCAKPCRPLLARAKAVCAKISCKVGCETGCETGCEAECTPRCTPVRDLLANARVRLCSKVSCEPTCDEPKCHKLYRRPVVELFDNLFSRNRCDDGCGVASCEGGACDEGRNGAPAPMPAPAPAAAPAKKAMAPAPVPPPEATPVPTPAG